jgi:hypothetical protein
MSASVNRSMAVPLVIGVLAIAAISMGAATLSTAESVGPTGGAPPIETPSPQDSLGPDEELNRSEGGGDEAASQGESSFQTLTSCNEFLASTPGTMAVVAGLFALMGLLYYRYNVALSLFVGWTVAPPIALAYFMLTDCGAQQQFVGQGGTSVGNVGQTLVPATDVPTWLIGVFVAGALVVAGAILYRTAGEEEIQVAPEEDEEEDIDLGRFAAAAGRAADRIEERNVDVDNAVYAAWIEMTDLLDVDNPETYAPSEFAETAIDLGMAEDDVQGLTTLFNEVRYGGKDASVREDRATDILRNIESEYGTPDESVVDEALDETDDETDGGTDE